MATYYLPVNAKQAALTQSQDWWEKILGRTKKPEDVTQYLCQVISNPTKPAQNFVVVTDELYAMVDPYLTPAQRTAYQSARVTESDPNVQECLNSLKPPTP